MRPAGERAESTGAEPTGFGSSVTNFFPLPFPSRNPVSEGATSAGFGGNSWGKPSFCGYQAAAARAKAADRRSSRFSVADGAAACGGAEGTAAYRGSSLWCLP